MSIKQEGKELMCAYSFKMTKKHCGYYGDGDGKNIRVDVCLSFSAPPHPDVCYTPISSEAGKEYLNIFHDLQNRKRKVTFLFQ